MARAAAAPKVVKKTTTKAKPRAPAKKAAKKTEEDSEDDDDEDENTGGARGGKEQLVLSLAPLTNIDQIFGDMVSRYADELGPVMEKLSRPLRIATMCSGTESPILALRLMFRQLEQQTGIKGRMHHIFSAEIEPFKQAYIERNFGPPLLFRDVTELPNDDATTAYGAKKAVPGDVDMLIAGTSCVDYSALNTKQKGIDSGGESGRTFNGMLKYVEKHQPGIVILENVSKAPWDQVIVKFAGIDYDAQVVRLDTKKYYIPHTRNRGYLIAIPKVKKNLFDSTSERKKGSAAMVEDWCQRIKGAERNASAPTEEFLLDSDDPRIHRARQEASITKVNADGSQRVAIDWYKCEQRHSVQRQLEKLGLQKPLTDWKEGGGKPQMPDGTWQDWAEGQTERVLDLMDISFLRDAKMGTDITYKTAIWNLSQNVDRTTASKYYGITPCLTPNMIAYLTLRGGPIIGLEALALQGLPIDELLLTRENSDQLADLAGNAMSSTVVGSAIMQALIVAGHTLRAAAPGDEGDIEMEEPKLTNEELNSRFRGEDRLKNHPVDFAASTPPPADLLDLADRSARKCDCEGPDGFSPNPISTCVKCGHSACAAHQGKPKHVYEDVKAERLLPDEFEAKLKAMLPMRLTIPGLIDQTLRQLIDEVTEKGVEVDGKLAKQYLKAIVPCLEHAEYHFERIHRRRGWSVTFRSDGARLELHLEKNLLEWRLFANPPADLATIDPLRLFLHHPVARLRLEPGTSSLLDGAWDLSIPLKSYTGSIDMSFQEFVPSWRAKLQLTDFLEEKRPKYIDVKFDGNAEALDRSIDGKYVLEDLCGTACNSLYRRCDPEEKDPLYFFFDPSSYLEVEHDRYVFADDCSRISTHRRLIASLDPKWRPPYSSSSAAISKSQRPKISIARNWTTLPEIKLTAGSANLVEDNQFSTIADGFKLSIGVDDCKFTENLLSAVVKLDKAPSSRWATDTFHEVDLHLEGPEVFSKIRWMLSRIPDWNVLQQWSEVDSKTIPKETCQSCAPAPPTVKWLREIKPTGVSLLTKIIALEDGKEAADFERTLKDRPSPVLLHTRQVGDHFELRIGLNAASLSHAALAQLPAPTLSLWKTSAPTVEWRLANSGTHGSKLGRQGLSSTFTIQSNRNSPSAEQPKKFKTYPLRPEQLRSLHWMVEQEANPKPWIEEEVAEYLLPEMNWHAEARAKREVTVRGGVVADAVGYGKTAITIALICARRKHDADPKPEKGRIAVKATLIVVPKHLMKQWPKEINKFTDSGLAVVQLDTAARLKKVTIQEIMDADIVIMPESLFTSPVFWALLTDFSASKTGCKFDDKGNRYFRHCVNEALETLGDQVDRLVDEGATAVYKKIQEARKVRAAPPTDIFIPATRKASNKATESKNDEEADDSDEGEKKKKPTKGKKKFVDMNEKELRKELATKDLKDDKDVVALTQDEWSLKSSEVKEDYTEMKAPPLAMFSFARIVVDEFTYTSGSVLVGIHHIRARARWVLSGTPPLSDFSEIKSIANLLHCHLGIHDPSEGKDKTVDMRNAEQTSAEKFRSFCDVRSRAWHARRDEAAQRFLDQYARQNVAEIDEIPLETEVINVQLPGAEMAIYRELEHHLYNIDPALAKIAKVKPEKAGDRDRRLREALGQSKTPEEALLKRCSHFTLDLDESELFDSNVESVCDFILRKRQIQLADCQEQFKRKIAACAYMHRWIQEQDWSDDKKLNATPHFLNTLSVLYVNGYGDREGNECLRGIAASVGCSWDAEDKLASVSRNAPKDSPKPTTKDVEALHSGRAAKEGKDEWAVAKLLLLRSASLELRRLGSELIGRYRSARYFDCVRNLVRKTDDETVEEDANSKDIAVLSCCGHSGTADEIHQAVREGRCVDPDCLASVNSQYILDSQALGTDVHSGNYGHKLETLVTLIKKTPKEDRCIVFVQFDDLFDKVHEALTVYGIPTTVILGDAKKQSTSLDDFQDVDKKGQKVLLLKATDSSSSGANLTVANWAYFVSPLLTDTKAQYKALATQAVGRIHRYGQLKTANIVHLLVPSTVDYDTFSNLNETPIAELVKSDRKPIVNPLREKSHKYEPRGKKALTAKEAADAEAWKKLDLEAEKERAWAGELPFNAEASTSKGKGKASTSKAPAKSTTAASKGKKKIEIVSDDDDIVFEDDEDEVEEESELSAVDSDVVIMGGDSDDFELDSSPKAAASVKTDRARRAKPRTSYVAQLDDSEESGEEEEESEGEPSPPPQKRKKRVIADSEEEESEEEEVEKVKKPSAPVPASKDKGKAKEVVQYKGKGKAKMEEPAKDGPPPAKKRKSIAPRSSFVGVIVPPPSSSPRSKKPLSSTSAPSSSAAKPSSSAAKSSSSSTKQGTLLGFFKKGPAPAPSSSSQEKNKSTLTSTFRAPASKGKEKKSEDLERMSETSGSKEATPDEPNVDMVDDDGQAPATAMTTPADELLNPLEKGSEGGGEGEDEDEEMEA